MSAWCRCIPEADVTTLPPNSNMANTVETVAVLGRYYNWSLLASQSVSLRLNAEDRKIACGKFGLCTSLDSSDGWDKVAISAEKLRNDAGRK